MTKEKSLKNKEKCLSPIFQARREKYAKVLSHHMDVDIYGKCGKFKCERRSEQDCYEMMERNYRFYLSFENSICMDYTTEKFFNVLK